MKKILYICNEIDFFVSHRLPLAVAANKNNIQVNIAANFTNAINEKRLTEYNLFYLPLNRKSRNIFKELYLIIKLFLLIKKIKPDIVNFITIKPIIYGSLICKFLKIKKIIFSISGLGHVFHNKGNFLKKILVYIFKFSSPNQGSYFFLQNEFDAEFLKKNNIIKNNKIIFTKGSGVDLNFFKPVKINQKKIVITLASRMVIEKGVSEFIETAKLFYKYDKSVEFWLVGKHDPDSPSSISLDHLRSINSSKENFFNLKWLGEIDDMRDIFKNSTIIVLPSYHEGCPKVLMEAAACGKPLIASDIPGCRQVVKNNYNGLLIKNKNTKSLYEAIKLIIYNDTALKKMSKNSIFKARKEFDINSVIEKHLEIYLK